MQLLPVSINRGQLLGNISMSLQNDVPVEFYRKLFLILSEGGLTHAEISEVAGFSARQLYRIKPQMGVTTKKNYRVPPDVKEAAKRVGHEMMADWRAELTMRVQAETLRTQAEEEKQKISAMSEAQKERRTTARRLVVYNWLTNANRLTRTGYKPARLDRSHINKRRLALM
ncbi:MAG TPA: hypothetical protein VFR09_05395, partial [Alphaproteobacteria bacterium]|nr:hypothetical protein [Alphaproteobacteria bacterium]